MAGEMLIKGGRVIDGTGTPGYEADVLIRDDLIKSIGPDIPVSDIPVVEAKGLTVAPGFIDAHTHAEFILASPRCGEYMEPFVRQGVTTMVTGNCGVSAAPVNEFTRRFLGSYWDSLMPEEGLSFSWSGMGEFVDHLHRQKLPVNICQLVGHGTVRLTVMGCKYGSPTSDELKSMRDLVGQSLKAGSRGLSYGLTYVPGIWADTHELIEVGRDLRTHKGRITVHLRSQTEFIESAVSEMIEVARTLKVPLQISHFVPYSLEYIDSFFNTLEMVDDARNEGLEIGHDMLTPPVSSTTVCHLYPAWMFESGFPAFLERLSDLKLRERIKTELKEKPKWPSWKFNCWAENMCSYVNEQGRPSWTRIRLSGFRRPENAAFEFASVEETATLLKKDPYDALFDLTLSENGRLFFTGFSTDSLDMDHLDIAAAPVLQLPECSFMTDSVGIGRGSKAATIYGTFPRFVGRHVREFKTFSLEEAVRKCTSLPAGQYGLADRGVLRENAKADLVIFDANTICDNATFTEPFKYAQGIQFVIVNGIPVWQNGEYKIHEGPGEVIGS
ncbi:MAG: amidohydrolase family protein [Desulfobacterales bacterium]